MATNPGILTNWPWKPLGNFKYLILTPWVAHSTYCFATQAENERDVFYFLIFPFLLSRLLHCQLWISMSRHQTAKGNTRIVDKGIDFDQVDRERNWDDQIILTAILFYAANKLIPGASHMPLWKTDGAVITILLHTGPVEFLYYWLHRALHNHFLYTRYHSHHHSSIVTEPITSVIHPFAEEVVYFMLFSIPMFTMVFTGTASILVVMAYVTYIDFMNNMGHCNFELVPKWGFSIFPPLKYFMYTPSFHSLHHTQFRTNYSLFMPIYDHVYGTLDKSSDTLYENSLKREEESPNVVHLTHLTTTDSVYHLRLGFASLASKPYASNWYLKFIMLPVTCWSVILAWIYGHAFISERNTFKKLKLQTWVVPRFNTQYLMQSQRENINNLIEEAILEAEKKGAKVLTLGLLNQHEELNRNGELYIQMNSDQLKTIRIVDGSSLVAAVVVNTIPKEITRVVLTGKVNKAAAAIALALCQKGIQVATLLEDEYQKLRHVDHSGDNLVLTKSHHDTKIWLVGDGLSEREQSKAPKGTIFIPFSSFPPKKARKDCHYHSTPALVAPKSLENMHSCENWLARRVVSAWRVAGIIHALEGWEVHECGRNMLGIDKVWDACLQHGFRPLQIPNY